MDIRITYCGMWNYLPKAQVVSVELRNSFENVNVELVKGSGGVFDVQMNERIIFSKHIKGRFPYEGEITKLLK